MRGMWIVLLVVAMVLGSMATAQAAWWQWRPEVGRVGGHLALEAGRSTGRVGMAWEVEVYLPLERNWQVGITHLQDLTGQGLPQHAYVGTESRHYVDATELWVRYFASERLTLQLGTWSSRQTWTFEGTTSRDSANGLRMRVVYGF